MQRPRHSHVFTKATDGFYVEPNWCSKRLFEVEKFAGFHIHDPACGWGTILQEARAAGYSVSGADIVDRRHNFPWSGAFRKRDFLTRRTLVIGNIVCNPPFDHVQEFCEHALYLGARKVAVICLLRRLNAAHWLQDLPLRRIWLLTPRPSMPPGSWIAQGNKPGGGTQDFCWLCFEKGYKGKPEIGWLHRDGAGTAERSKGTPLRSVAGAKTRRVE